MSSQVTVKNPLIVTGGEEPNLQSKYISISSNGTTYYYPSSDNCDGYNQVEVDVNVSPNVGYKSISSNGDYYASSDGYQGYNHVYVNVPTPQPSLTSKSISSNGTYYASDDKVDGYSTVYVDVSANVIDKNIGTLTSNGNYNYQAPLLDGVDGYSRVSFSVDVEPNFNTMNTDPRSNVYYEDTLINVSPSPSQTGLANLRSGTHKIAKCAAIKRTNLLTIDLLGSSADTFIESIGDSAFSGCTGLTNVSVSTPVSSFGPWAFSGCTGLTNVSLNTLGTCSYGSGTQFQSCSNLTNVSFGPAWEQPNLSGQLNFLTAVFQYCPISSVTVDSNNPTYDSRDNCNGIVRTVDNTLISGIYGVTTIPSTVTGLEGIYFNTTNLYSFTLPDHITTLLQTFFGCHDMTTITINSTSELEVIGLETFYGCTSLTHINLPATLTTIGDSAFYNCISLTDITFGGSISEWEQVSRGSNWHQNVPATVVRCSDGEALLDQEPEEPEEEPED